MHAGRRASERSPRVAVTPSGRPRFVLVHGSRLSSTQWRPQVPLLERAGPVALVDLPGHGSRSKEPFTLDRAAEVIAEAVAEASSDEAVVLVGHSLGGYAAMTYAARHPKSLAGLVLAGSSATPVGAGAAVYRWVARVTDRLGEQRMTRINNRVLRRLYRPELIEPVIAGGYWFAPTPAAWREVMERCRPSMLWAVECPVLLLNGRFDQFRVGVRDYLRACIDGRAETIPRAGHFSNLDRPEAFAAAVMRFADEVTTPSGSETRVTDRRPQRSLSHELVHDDSIDRY
ncbi:alpha/beta fold hydrolase [Ruicaihuangia caeni]|uniref:Alpha/beta hydrolase n=1 Tax=Ruicaihuangia caeni TaxID=3042517 RepID=A0AAW6TCF3_9MICO|nr:alpha/beta hydrolase [Klugiella sp. YN-L-19]MDI2099267.1 alpha/beta hydrolase [Klugiella sp. YN-L-19]